MNSIKSKYDEDEATRPVFTQSISISSDELSSNISVLSSTNDESDSGSGGGWQVAAVKKRDKNEVNKFPVSSSDSNTTTSSELSTNSEQNNSTTAQAMSGENFNIAHIEVVKRHIEKNVKTMVILRGPSGSGKSTLASQIKFSGVIASADLFFTTKQGVYLFDPFKLTEAHQFCRNRAKEALMNGISPVIIDNTNITIAEFKPYVMMSLRHNYNVEIIEPNTPWKNNAHVLSNKTRHSVPLAKIKKTVENFEKLSDTKKFIEQCRRELNSSPTPSKSTSPKVNQRVQPKSSGLLGNFNDILSKNDWSLLPEISDLPVVKNQAIKSSSQSPIVTFSLGKGTSGLLKEPKESSLTTISREVSFESLEKSKSMIMKMFPNIGEEIILDFLIKYENDTDMVTNILLDSVNLEEELVVVATAPLTTKQMPKLYVVKSLQEICLDVMNKLEISLEKHFNKIELSKTDSPTPHMCKKPLIRNEKELASSEKVTSTKIREEKMVEYNELDHVGVQVAVNEDEICQNEDEPIMSLNVSKTFMKSLIELFGSDADDAQLLNENNDIGVGLNLAFGLFSSWKRSVESGQVKTSKNLNDEKEQIKRDKALSLALFDQINGGQETAVAMVAAADNLPILSLRQIMAEQMCEEYQRDRSRKQNSASMPTIPLNNSRFIAMSNNSSESNLASATLLKPSENIANRIKLQQMREKYENLVDARMIEEILENKGFNATEASKFINEFYNFQNIKEPNNVFNLKSTKSNRKSAAGQVDGASKEKLDYYNVQKSLEYFAAEEGEDTEEGRVLARKYLNLRQDYFEKATEAYNRGWGAVAQYYAEMGHNCSFNMKKSNNLASMQIFMTNNIDIQHSNTLDLHGLHVKEAIGVLKNVLNEKRNELKTLVSKKKKTYLFVITGNGNHSENGPRIRPNVINYLNQNRIKFREPHNGLLQISLL